MRCAFQNECGVSEGDFIKLLQLYVERGLMFEGKTALQKSGFDSCVAPVLKNIYLASADRKIESLVNKRVFNGMARYVPDYLIVLVVFNSNMKKTRTTS